MEQHALHEKAVGFYRTLNMILYVPAILLSTIGSAANMSVSSGDHQPLQLIFSSMSLFSTAVFTIHRYMQLPELQQAHMFYTDEFKKLSNEIKMHMSIDESGNKMFVDLVEFTKYCKGRLDMLVDKAPLIPDWCRPKGNRVTPLNSSNTQKS